MIPPTFSRGGFSAPADFLTPADSTQTTSTNSHADWLDQLFPRTGETLALMRSLGRSQSDTAVHPVLLNGTEQTPTDKPATAPGQDTVRETPRNLDGDRPAVSETNLFRQRMRDAGIDPDRLRVTTAVYEPPSDGDREHEHPRLVRSFISDRTYGLSHDAPTQMIEDREIRVNLADYLNRPNGLRDYITAYSEAGMDSLTRAIQHHVLDAENPARVFNVSQAFSPIWCVKDVMKEFDKDPERYAPFIRQLLGNERGDRWINETKENNRQVREAQANQTAVAIRQDRELRSQLMQGLYDQVDRTLTGNRGFDDAMQRYRDVTRRSADRGTMIVVAVGNDGDFGRWNGIRTRPGAEYNWYCMSDHVISVGGSDINHTPGNRSDDRMYLPTSHGTDRWHATICAQATSLPAQADDGQVNGTSFAAPQVSATIALMLEQNPRLTLQDVRRILEQNATRIDGVAANDQGAGILELDRAVVAARRSR